VFHYDLFTLPGLLFIWPVKLAQLHFHSVRISLIRDFYIKTILRNCIEVGIVVGKHKERKRAGQPVYLLTTTLSLLLDLIIT